MSGRKFLGENLEDCSVEELHSLEVKLEKSLHVIRGKKVSAGYYLNFLQYPSVKKKMMPALTIN
jgi:hypothetical protein